MPRRTSGDLPLCSRIELSELVPQLWLTPSAVSGCAALATPHRKSRAGHDTIGFDLPSGMKRQDADSPEISGT
jgi:hypothetical protein